MGADPDVCAMLESVGLGVLAARFAAEEIDAATLRSLGNDDLEELGLTPEQRRVLLARLGRDGATAALPGGPGTASDAVAAAEQALQRSAHAEAAALLTQAEQAIGMSPTPAEADALRLRILIARSALARVQQGIASEEAGRLGRQVLELAQKLRETTSELMALTGLYTHALVRAEYYVAGKWAELLSERAAQAQDETFRMIGRRGMGVVALHTGALDRSVPALREALDSYDAQRHLPLAHAHGYDHAEICSAFLSFGLWISGDPVGGRAMSEFSVSHSRRIGHTHSLAQALVFRAMLMAVAQDWESCRAAGAEGVALWREHGLAVMGTACGFFATVAELALAPAPPDASALKRLRQAHADFRKVNPFNYQQMAGLLLARLLLRAGALADAEEALQQAEAVQDRTKEIFLQPELLRMRAEVLMAKGDVRGAQARRAAAVDTAIRMGATMFALRIACDMADENPTEEMRSNLAAVRARLVSTDGEADLRRCEALLGNTR